MCLVSTLAQVGTLRLKQNHKKQKNLPNNRVGLGIPMVLECNSYEFKH